MGQMGSDWYNHWEGYLFHNMLLGMKTYIHASHIHTWLTSRELFCSEPVKTKSISFYINQHTNQNISCLQNTIIVQLYFAKKKKLNYNYGMCADFFLRVYSNFRKCWLILLAATLDQHFTFSPNQQSLQPSLSPHVQRG